MFTWKKTKEQFEKQIFSVNFISPNPTVLLICKREHTKIIAFVVGSMGKRTHHHHHDLKLFLRQLLQLSRLQGHLAVKAIGAENMITSGKGIPRYPTRASPRGKWNLGIEAPRGRPHPQLRLLQ